MLLCSTDYDSDSEQEYIVMAQQNKVDGIIGLTYNPNLTVNKDIPFVSIDRCINADIPCVSSNNFAGGACVPQSSSRYRISPKCASVSCWTKTGRKNLPWYAFPSATHVAELLWKTFQLTNNFSCQTT